MQLKIKNFIQLFLDLVFPRFCLLCNREGVWLCSDCFDKLADNLIIESFCPYCERATIQAAICSLCRRQSNLDKLIFSLPYTQGGLKTIIYNFKFSKIKELALPLSQLIEARTKQLKLKLDSNIILMPIPLHRRRLNWRGFNQAEEIAKILSQKTGLVYKNNTLKRVRPTKPQTKLTGKIRRLNLKQAFIAKNNPGLSKKTVWLIDDVTTTHTTMEEAASALKKANPDIKKIYGVTVAKS